MQEGESWEEWESKEQEKGGNGGWDEQEGKWFVDCWEQRGRNETNACSSWQMFEIALTKAK